MSEVMPWIDGFPGLGALSPEIRNYLLSHSTVVPMPKGQQIFGPGKAPDKLLLLLSGTIRVQQTSDGGREIVLYRVSAGESCVLTTACLLAYEDYLAEGITETDIEAVAISKEAFEELIASSAIFRRFVFAAYSRRITELFRIIEDIAFRKIDIRLAQRLVELAPEDKALSITHQELAQELGTAREVISRQLEEFRRRGWLAMSRGTVEITNRGALIALSEMT